MTRSAGGGRLPNFLVLGAAKSGTTALYEYLGQHPEVFLSPSKEPQFFAFEGERLSFQGPGVTINETAVTTLDAYRSLFAGVRAEKAVGEASALYLYVAKAADRIRHYLPQARLIAILRDPIDRAYSSYMHLRREGREPLEFRAALRAEPERIAANWGFLWRYRDLGRYHDQLKRFYERFPREQIQVLLYDDFRDDAPGTLLEVFRFLAVDEGFRPDTSVKHNVSGIPTSRRLYDLLWGRGALGRLRDTVVPATVLSRLRARSAGRLLRQEPLDPGLREELIPGIREDVLRLQDLIDRDLARWLEPARRRVAS
jgi:hypothetical protein